MLIMLEIECEPSALPKVMEAIAAKLGVPGNAVLQVEDGSNVIGEVSVTCKE